MLPTAARESNRHFPDGREITILLAARECRQPALGAILVRGCAPDRKIRERDNVIEPMTQENLPANVILEARNSKFDEKLNRRRGASMSVLTIDAATDEHA